LILVSIDPGLSSSFAFGYYSETEPYTLLKAYQFTGGVAGMIQWVSDRRYQIEEADDWVCERFVPLNNRGFGLTSDSIEPIAVEGALQALGVIDRSDKRRMRRANEQYLFNAPSKAKKRSLLKEFLKDTGNYVYGKQLGQPDNEDAVSAIAHAISYLTRVENHKPTYDLVSSWNDGRIESRKG